MRIVVVASFLNEERFLTRFLESVNRQARHPDRLLLVDDGSTDRSPGIAKAFAAASDFAVVLSRPQRPTEADRLATAAELRAFQWGVAQIDEPYDILVKMDTDLDLTPGLLAEVEDEFRRNPRLGVAGAYLSVEADDGSLTRERCPAHHVRGPNKFYRRRCYEEIQPVLPFLGWDTVDEVKARMNGWETRSLSLREGDPIHLRPTGSHDGALRAYRRWGRCACGYGAEPLYSVLVALSYSRHRPRGIAGINYLWGWFFSYLQGAPRAAPDVRRFVRVEQRAVLRALLRGERDPRVGSPARGISG